MTAGGKTAGGMTRMGSPWSEKASGVDDGDGDTVEVVIKYVVDVE